MRDLISIAEGILDPSPKERVILLDMLGRAPKAEVERWALANGYEAEDLADEDGWLNVFEQWLDSERSVGVSGGIVTFWRLDHRDIRAMIARHPVRLYHFTSSARVPSIRKLGLVAGRRSVNRTSAPGVYLTTEADGPHIRGYVANALRGARTAHGVRIEVSRLLSDLEPDPDDADIRSGATQFVTDHVPPEAILAIERA